MVAVGMTLFAVGFILTISALSGMALPGAHGASQGLGSSGSGDSQTEPWMIMGFIISLAGLVLATVGPAVSFIKAGRQRN